MALIQNAMFWASNLRFSLEVDFHYLTAHPTQQALQNCPTLEFVACLSTRPLPLKMSCLGLLKEIGTIRSTLYSLQPRLNKSSKSDTLGIGVNAAIARQRADM